MSFGTPPVFAFALWNEAEMRKKYLRGQSDGGTVEREFVLHVTDLG